MKRLVVTVLGEDIRPRADPIATQEIAERTATGLDARRSGTSGLGCLGHAHVRSLPDLLRLLQTAAPRLAAVSLHLFAGVRVRDFQAARLWYEQLLGDPTFFPHATEAVWTLAEDRSVYVVEHPDGAGHSVVTIFLDDLDAQVAAIAARGLEPDARETYSGGVRKLVYRDPDGNEIGFGGA